MKYQLTEKEISDYVSGMSVREIEITSTLSAGAIKSRLREVGLLRTRAEGTKVAYDRGVNLGPITRLSENENGPAYAAVLSQEWIRKPLGVSV